MKLLILAAGYATRLYPLTLDQPKPLLPVSGKPMIDHVIDKFMTCPGLDEIYVVTNNKFAGKFEAWSLKAMSHYKGKKIRIINDGTTSEEDRLGAIGDIHFVLQNAQIQDDLIVVAGDNLFGSDLEDFFRRLQDRRILVGVYNVKSLEEIKKYNNITLNEHGQVTFFEEKPKNPTSTVTAIALYHYPRESLPFIQQYIDEGNNRDQPGRLVQWLYTRTPVFTHLIKGQWLDIGSKESYQEANELFKREFKSTTQLTSISKLRLNIPKN